MVVTIARAAAIFVLSAAIGSPAVAQEPLAYRVPTPATAIYEVTDTLNQTMNTPGGVMTATLAVVVTLATTFEADPGGVRVTGRLESVTASMSGPMGSDTQEPSVTGDLVFVLGGRGDVAVVSEPGFGSPAGAATPLQGLPYELFPALPGSEVEAGASWVDTVTWSTSGPDGQATNTVVYTYTLAGDTVVDGRTLLNIAISGDVEVEGTMNTPGGSMQQSFSGTNTGFALWDTEAGRLHSMEINRDQRGTMRVPGQSIQLRITGVSRRRLVN